MKRKTEKKILVCMLWLCAIACFSGFPWIFFNWETITSIFRSYDKASGMTIVLFREQCLFFGFFCIYFLHLKNLGKYKTIIKLGSALIAFMGVFMYALKIQTGLSNLSSDYEPFIWFAVGGCMFYLNSKMENVIPEKEKIPVLTTLFRIIAAMLILNTYSIIFPETAWNIMFKIPYDTISTYDKYTFGMICGFMAFSSVIVYYISNRIKSFAALSKSITIFLALCFIGFFIWGNPSDLYEIPFWIYTITMETLSCMAIIHIMKKNKQC